MRIQHNIMAMNAYRNYNNNNKALSGNLEKLSSGYKINRAGDDAAGLAISEKMRAQITGLNAAQKNVKDGISLVKTAEGAMQEIQDMLNRMDYLATQSANGTYQDEVDREALQKEVNQLKDEINRIADSANFNGIKLLDGTWDVDGKTKAVEAAQAALDAANAALDETKIAPKADAVYGEAMSTDEIKDMMLPEVAAGNSGSAANVGTNTVLETDKIEYQKPSFQVNFNGVKHTMVTAAGTGGTGAITVTLGTGAAASATISITEDDIVKYLKERKLVDEEDIKAGLEVDSETLAAVFVDKIKKAAVGTAASATGGVQAGQVGDGKYAWDVRQDGESLVFEFANNNVKPTTPENSYFDTKITGIAQKDIDATGGTFTTGAFTQTTGGDTSVSITAKIGGQNVTFTGKAATGAVTLSGLKSAVENATATIDGKTVKLSDYFKVTADANGNNGTLDITSIATGKEGSDSIEKFKVTLGTGGGYTNVAKKDAWTDGTDAYTQGTNGYINAGTEVTIPGLPAESEQLASTTLNLTDLDIVDGMKIKLGDTEYTFAVGADSKFKDAENVVDLTNIESDKLKTVDNGGTQADRNTALSKLAEAAKDNAIFTVSHEKNAGTSAGLDQIGLKQKAEAKDSTDMTTMDNFASYISISTVDEKATEAAQKELDAKQPELIAKAEQDVKDAQAVLDEANAGEAKALNLQIGDTSDSFNQLGVKIGSMKTDALKITDLSVSTADDAAGAINVIKDAINYVSSVRGDLGAYQNRLDHTANNLSVMAENIQDAESTIRDTDVAEEMMSYVKNNILVQSAQAMLAQANQVPQGVLQLLG